MSNTTDAIRNHHRSLLQTLETYTENVVARRDPANAQQLAAFLNEELLPHAQGEELHLYPALNPILREQAEPTATMSLDHKWIESGIRRIAELARALSRADGADRPILQEKLSRLALQMLAVVTLHVGKEEAVFLPIMERSLTEREQDEILGRMHETGEQAAARNAGEEAAGHGHCHCSCGDHDDRRAPNR